MFHPDDVRSSPLGFYLNRVARTKSSTVLFVWTPPMFARIRVITTRYASQRPPLYFTNPSNPPHTYGEPMPPPLPAPSGFEASYQYPAADANRATYGSNTQENSHNNNHKQGESMLTGIANALATLALVYFALDNYLNRIKLEKANEELVTINLKTLQLQEANHQAARKKRDMNTLQERKDRAKRDMKMALHIALLTKQLEEANIPPAKIDDVIREYEQSVKIDNSIRNILSQSLWLDDNSELKPYLPNVHEYDKKLGEKRVVD